MSRQMIKFVTKRQFGNEMKSRFPCHNLLNLIAQCNFFFIFTFEILFTGEIKKCANTEI